MNSLFDQQPIFPDGFQYYPDFLTEQEEHGLIESTKKLQLHPLIFQGFEAKRKVQSFGYDYNFDSRKASKGTDIPDDFRFLIDKAAAYTNIPPEDFEELLATEYPPGAVINWHRDAPPFDIIVGISLLSDCKFKLRPYDKAKQGRKSILSLEVKRRSLYIVRGEARSEWEHSIAPVNETRYSITLRTMRK